MLQEEGEISPPLVRKSGGAEEPDSVKQGHPLGQFWGQRIEDILVVGW